MMIVNGSRVWRVAVLGVGVAACALQAQEAESKLSLHGYLTQAYAKADKLPINGITKDGTWDYRVMALQVRYNLTENDQFVVQTRNRRLGLGLFNDENVVLDWAYYSHKFGNFKGGSTTLKVGRVPLAVGLYNELRVVGTVLPFFRAPGVFYLPGLETIDGISLLHQLPLGAWSLESNPYWGGFTALAVTIVPTGPLIGHTRSENIYGLQEWLNTPIPGLRMGGSYQRFKSPNTTLSDTTANNYWAGSLDGTFEQFFVRGEYSRYVVTNLLPGNVNFSGTSYYGQAGVKLIEPLWLNLQEEVGLARGGGFRYRSTNDRAVALSYLFDPNLVFKVEGHAVKGYNFDTYVAPGGPPGTTHYGIASLSVSF